VERRGQPPRGGRLARVSSSKTSTFRLDAKAGSKDAAAPKVDVMAQATLTIASKNYGSWSLRGWLMCKLAGLDFAEAQSRSDDPSVRAELLLLSPSFLVPRLTHDGINIWDTLAIAEYLNELKPEAGLVPATRSERAHCRAISGEMHSGFSSLRSALPMNIKAHYPGFKVWAGARADIERIIAIWRDCLAASGGPYLFGASPCMADAMFAPVVTRFLTYDVSLDAECAAYCATIMAVPAMQEWTEAAKSEPDELEELDVEF
jgi:glutathione S-transferase